MTSSACAASSDEEEVFFHAQGEDAGWWLIVRDKITGKLVDLTNAQGYFTVRHRYQDVVTLIEKKTFNVGGGDDQLYVLDQTIAANFGRAQVFVKWSDSIGIDISQSPFKCDAWFVLPSGKRHQVVRVRNYTIGPRVTHVPA